MSIQKYADEMDSRVVGQIANLQDSVVKGRFADEIVEFGRAVMVGASAGSSVKNIKKSKASLTYSADFISSNSTVVTVNGVSISPVVYATSHAATFAALIAAINALSGVSAVAGTGREILITIDGAVSNIEVSSTTTGGGSQPTTTIAYSSVDVLEGIAALRHAQPSSIGGDDKYKALDEVNVLTRGVVAVEVVATVAYGNDAYVYNDTSEEDSQGKFTNSASGNTAVSGGKFRSAAVGTVDAPAIALLEINLPN